MTELRSERKDLALGDRAVVAARHGLAFSAAFVLIPTHDWAPYAKQTSTPTTDSFCLKSMRSARPAW